MTYFSRGVDPLSPLLSFQRDEVRLLKTLQCSKQPHKMRNNTRGTCFHSEHYRQLIAMWQKCLWILTNGWILIQCTDVFNVNATSSIALPSLYNTITPSKCSGHSSFKSCDRRIGLQIKNTLKCRYITNRTSKFSQLHLWSKGNVEARFLPWWHAAGHFCLQTLTRWILWFVEKMLNWYMTFKNQMIILSLNGNWGI